MYQIEKQKSLMMKLLEGKLYEDKPNLVNSNSFFMKILCRENPELIIYATEKAIDEELIDIVLEKQENKEKFLNDLFYECDSKTSIRTSPLFMKRACEINGKFFFYAQKKACTFENFQIALNNPNPKKRLDAENVQKCLETGNKSFNYEFTPEYDLENFCKCNGKFLNFVSKKIIVPKQIIEIALSHEEEKRPKISKVVQLMYHKTNELYKMMVSKDGVYLMYIPEEYITEELLDIALNNPDSKRRISFDRVPKDSEENYLYRKKKSPKIIQKLMVSDKRWLDYTQLEKTDVEFVLNVLNIDEDLPRAFLDSISLTFRSNIDVMKKLCSIDGIYALSGFKDNEVSKELIKIAQKITNPKRQLLVERISRGVTYDCDILKELIEEDPRWIFHAKPETIDEDTFIKLINNDNFKYIPHSQTILKFANNERIIDALRQNIVANKYDINNIKKMLEVNIDSEFIKSKLFSLLIERQCIGYNLDYNFVATVINNIVKLNEKVLTSLNYEFFHERFHSIYNDNSDKLYKLINHPEIQKKIIDIGTTKNIDGTINEELSRKKIDLFVKIINNAVKDYKEGNEWVTYYNIVIEAFTNNPELYNYMSKHQDELDDKTLETLTDYTLGSHGFSIRTIEDLKNYDEVKEEWIRTCLKKAKGEEYRNAVFEKLFNISADMADDLYSQYCDCILDSESNFDYRIVLFFKQLEKLQSMKTKEVIESLITNSEENKVLKLNSKEVIHLKTLIKRQLVKEYNKTMYTTKDKAVDDTLEGVSLYKVAGEDGSQSFNLTVHSIAAYSSINRYSDSFNFKDSWNRPQMENHGICTSYMGNNCLANVGVETVMYGFNNFEYGSLLLSLNRDLGSNNTTFDIATDEGRKSEFLLPKDMIITTTNGYNEMVYERIVDGKKRQPAYAILLCDDYEQAKATYLKFKKQGRYDSDSKFIEEGKDPSYEQADIFYNTLKAAKEFGIPIVIVERKKIAIKERERIIKRTNDFKEDDKLNREEVKTYLYDTLGSVESNHNGYLGFEKYEEMFNKGLSKKVINTFMNKIDSLIEEEPITAYMIIEELQDFIKVLSKRIGHINSFDIYELRKQVNAKKQEVISSYNYPNHIGVVLNSKIGDNEYLLEYNQVLKNVVDKEQYQISDINKKIKKDYLQKSLLTISEITDDNLYDKNDIEKNRHVENLILFSTLIASEIELSDYEYDLLLTASLYKNYSNLETLKEKYEEKDIKLISAILYLNNKPDTKIEEVCQALSIENIDEKTMSKIELVSKCLQDASTLEKTRFRLDENPFSYSLLNFDISKKLVKVATQINEYYVYQDVIALSETNPDLYSSITDSLTRTRSPKKTLEEYKNITKKDVSVEVNTYGK